MTLEDQKPSKEGRVMKKAVRKTAEGKESAVKAEKQRQKNQLLLKANLKDKKTDNKDDDDSDWESVEEDAPVVRLEELLANMNIQGQDDDEDDENEEEEDENEEDEEQPDN